jgi:hypothetical protein
MVARNTARTAIIFLSMVAMLLGVSVGIAKADKTGDMNVPVEAVLIVSAISILIVILFYYVGDYRLKPKMNTKAALKSNPQLLETEIGLTFCEDHFVSVSTGGLISGTTEAKYEAVLVVCEVKDYFYLHVKPNVFFIIDKRDFTQGTPEEFTALLGKVLPGKKVRRYRGREH